MDYPAKPLMDLLFQQQGKSSRAEVGSKLKAMKLGLQKDLPYTSPVKYWGNENCAD